MHRMLLYTLLIVALVWVQACHQIHHNLTFPACSGRSLGRSLTRDLSTMTLANLCQYGNPFSQSH